MELLVEAQRLYDEDDFEACYNLCLPLALNERNGDAMFFLGSMYMYGEFVEQNEQEAINWWKRGTKAGSRECAFALNELTSSTKHLI